MTDPEKPLLDERLKLALENARTVQNKKVLLNQLLTEAEALSILYTGGKFTRLEIYEAKIRYLIDRQIFYIFDEGTTSRDKIDAVFKQTKEINIYDPTDEKGLTIANFDVFKLFKYDLHNTFDQYLRRNRVKDALPSGPAGDQAGVKEYIGYIYGKETWFLPFLDYFALYLEVLGILRLIAKSQYFYAWVTIGKMRTAFDQGIRQIKAFRDQKFNFSTFLDAEKKTVEDSDFARYVDLFGEPLRKKIRLKSNLEDAGESEDESEGEDGDGDGDGDGDENGDTVTDQLQETVYLLSQVQINFFSFFSIRLLDLFQETEEIITFLPEVIEVGGRLFRLGQSFCQYLRSGYSSVEYPPDYLAQFVQTNQLKDFKRMSQENPDQLERDLKRLTERIDQAIYDLQVASFVGPFSDLPKIVPISALNITSPTSFFTYFLSVIDTPDAFALTILPYIPYKKPPLPPQISKEAKFVKPEPKDVVSLEKQFDRGVGRLRKLLKYINQTDLPDPSLRQLNSIDEKLFSSTVVVWPLKQKFQRFNHQLKLSQQIHNLWTQVDLIHQPVDHQSQFYQTLAPFISGTTYEQIFANLVSRPVLEDVISYLFGISTDFFPMEDKRRYTTFLAVLFTYFRYTVRLSHRDFSDLRLPADQTTLLTTFDLITMGAYRPVMTRSVERGAILRALRQKDGFLYRQLVKFFPSVINLEKLVDPYFSFLFALTLTGPTAEDQEDTYYLDLISRIQADFFLTAGQIDRFDLLSLDPVKGLKTIFGNQILQDYGMHYRQMTDEQPDPFDYFNVTIAPIIFKLESKSDETLEDQIVRKNGEDYEDYYQNYSDRQIMDVFGFTETQFNNRFELLRLIEKAEV